MTLASAPSGQGDGNILTTVSDWVVGLMDILGAPGAGIAIALENIFPPLPSELILPAAGFAASQGQLNLVEVIVWTTLGSLVGALVLYGIGAALGVERLRWVADKVPLMRAADVDKTVAWFGRHGYKAVFFGRMLPIFRSLISIPAGVERMTLWKFALLTTAGSLIWNTIFVVGGYLLGENWHLVEEYAGVFQRIVIVLVAIAVVWFVVQRVRSIRRARRERAEQRAAEPRTDGQPAGDA
jgi:membrane protein DedA with SNARE-associated domain